MILDNGKYSAQCDHQKKISYTNFLRYKTTEKLNDKLCESDCKM